MDEGVSVCRVLLKRALKKGSEFSQRIEGESMRPTLKPGQTITIAYAAPKDIRLGDVLVFHGLENNIVHRLVDLKKSDGKTLYITMGDNNLVLDPPFDYSSVLGRLSKVEGTAFSELESPQERVLIVERLKRQARLGRRVLFILWPLRKIKFLLIGKKEIGAMRLVKKLTRMLT